VSETRKLAAILVSDVVGYSRLAGADEDRILARLRTLRSDLIDPTIAVHHGRIVKRTGDGSIIEFRSVVDAVLCAIEVQNGLGERNAGVPPDKRIEFRIGIHLGDVVEESDGDLMGDGVNIAARLEGVAKPGAICLSEQAYWQVKGRLDLTVSDLGQTQLKNIAGPVRVYLLEVGQPVEAKPAAATTAAVEAKRVPPPSTARAFSRWPVLAAALAVIVFAAGGYAWHAGFASRIFGVAATEDKLANAPRLSIVVLPFENLSGDREQDYFVDGITDDLTTDLSRLHESFVISRNTAFTYKGKPVDAKAIGRELGVRYVLEGSVRPIGETVAVNAQLISTETGAHVWADRFEGERSKLGQLQFEVVTRLARSLDNELTRVESLRAMRERPSNPDAVDLRLRGEAMMRSPHRDKPTWGDMTMLFERAHALDPQDERAMMLLATALALRVLERWSDDPSGDLKRADELLDAAMALQPDDSWAHLTRGIIHTLKNQHALALMETETAIDDDRNNVYAYANVGIYKMLLGRSQDGVADVETALRLGPHDFGAPQWQGYLCMLHAHLSHWREAIEHCDKAVAGGDRYWGTIGHLAAANAWAGRDKEAKEAIALLHKVDPNVTVQTFQADADANDNPTFQAEMARIIEGLRKAGLPEGEKKTN
jgi:TolB-like protein/class 3 adenylate cyclase